jgi:hypothetical protein
MDYMPGLGESGLALSLLALVLLIAPFVAIQRAARRRRRKELSGSAVVLASVASIAAVLLALTLVFRPFYAVALVLVNFAWLGLAVHTNREVSRRLTPSGVTKGVAR